MTAEVLGPLSESGELLGVEGGELGAGEVAFGADVDGGKVWEVGARSFDLAGGDGAAEGLGGDRGEVVEGVEVVLEGEG